MIKKGFTLIEVLVVIAIMAILASLVIVGLNLAKKAANRGRAVQSFKHISLAMHLYYKKTGNWPNPRPGYPGNYLWPQQAFFLVDPQNPPPPAFVPEFYSNWNATYYCKNCFYSFQIYDNNNDKEPDIGYIMIRDASSALYIYNYAICLTSTGTSLCGKTSYFPKN